MGLLAFTIHNNATGGEDIWLSTADGPAVLLANGAQNRTPSWSADGRYLLFSSDVDGVFNVYAWDREGGGFFRLSHVLGGLFYPVVDPDGRFYAIFTGPHTIEDYVRDLPLIMASS